MAGSILAFSSVILVVAFLRIWPVKGLAIRAALIAALMKSISPSAVIIGPMTGIFLEGALIELAILIVGMNKPALILGGMLAVWSALLHKLVTLLLVYGADMVTILDNLYQYAVRQIGSLGTGLWEPIALVSLVYWATGALAAWIGLRIKPDDAAGFDQGKAVDGHNLFELTSPGQYSLTLLAVILTGMVGIMTLINLSTPLIYLPATALFLAFLAIRYRRALRPLTRPKFWIQLVVITFLAALLIDGLETGQWLAWHGIQAGLLINLRAVTVLMSFAALGTELKNPLIKSLLYRRGFAELYQSLQMAFTLLPALMAQLPDRMKSLRDIPHLASRFLGLSTDLYQIYSAMSSQRPHVFLIIGERQTGKTTFISRLVEDLTQSGIRVGGFVARVAHQNEQVEGYTLRLLSDDTEHQYCMRHGASGWERIGRFFIDPAGQALGMRAFAQIPEQAPQVFVVDEVGPLEMGNRGWSSGLSALCSQHQLIQIWSVRSSLQRKVTRKWPGYQYHPVILDQHSNPADLKHEIIQLLQNHSQ